jgi:predicted aspartyl protease
MSFPFNPHEGLIIVPVHVAGPNRAWTLRLALDTGATSTLISGDLLEGLGYDPSAADEFTDVTTASGVELAPIIHVQRLEALGVSRDDLPVLCYELPSTAGFDGVLGLDFLRGCVLTLDFKTGRLTLDA